MHNAHSTTTALPGKSACVAMLNQTLGEYAAVAKKDMLYASSLVNQEGPTPFTKMLMGKRLATFEVRNFRVCVKHGYL